ncbi:hypothetical protein [Smaragdicoccus niigatensis]|uniref:hypothetical protein n=1 Tax=Smaragdicoccus niigatensis TaxID=359359 RepID=UPI0012DEE149|nr:hypothetical protein [Smaragdicoccus niigatensis]
MTVTKFVVTAASVGCLALASTGVVSAAPADVRVQTYGPVITPGWVSNVYGFSARDICRFLFPSDSAPHNQVLAAGLSLTYSTVSETFTESQGAAGAESSISGVQKLTHASAVMAQCR